MRRLLLCALLPLSASAQSQWPPLPPLLQADGAITPTWRIVSFPRKQADKPVTRFEADMMDGRPALKVSTASSYGNLVHDWHGPAPTRLQWRWRLDQPLAGGKTAPDLTTKAGDDAALKVCVMFDHPLERVPFVERTVLRIARSISGEALPAATLCYVWDSAAPAGLQGANPYTRRVRFISLQGQGAPLSKWVNESRDVVQDFATLFADELSAGSDMPRVSTVLIGADSDNTASHSSGWVSDLRWTTGAP